MERIIKLFEIYGSEPFKMWLGTSLGVTISKPEDVQVIISIKKFHNVLFKLIREINWFDENIS